MKHFQAGSSQALSHRRGPDPHLGHSGGGSRRKRPSEGKALSQGDDAVRLHVLPSQERGMPWVPRPSKRTLSCRRGEMSCTHDKWLNQANVNFQPAHEETPRVPHYIESNPHGP